MTTQPLGLDDPVVETAVTNWNTQVTTKTANQVLVYDQTTFGFIPNDEATLRPYLREALL